MVESRFGTVKKKVQHQERKKLRTFISHSHPGCMVSHAPVMAKRANKNAKKGSRQRKGLLKNRLGS